MKTALAQHSFSTRDTDSPSERMESMKLDSPPVKSEKESLAFDDKNGNSVRVLLFY